DVQRSMLDVRCSFIRIAALSSDRQWMVDSNARDRIRFFLHRACHLPRRSAEVRNRRGMKGLVGESKALLPAAVPTGRRSCSRVGFGRPTDRTNWCGNKNVGFFLHFYRPEYSSMT